MAADSRQQGERHKSLEELLDATSSAPTFGMNARELILQASRRIAEEESKAKDKVTDKKADTKEEKSKMVLKLLFSKGPELLQALPKDQRPLVPYKAINSSKVPRVNRQSVLERLTGQHLAINLHKAGQPPTPVAVLQNSDLCKTSIADAVAQEQALYQRGKAAKSVYLNYAAKTNAGLYQQPAPSEPAEQKATIDSVAAQEQLQGDTGASIPAQPSNEARQGHDPSATQIRDGNLANEKVDRDAEGSGKACSPTVQPAAAESSRGTSEAAHNPPRKRLKTTAGASLREADVSGDDFGPLADSRMQPSDHEMVEPAAGDTHEVHGSAEYDPAEIDLEPDAESSQVQIEGVVPKKQASTGEKVRCSGKPGVAAAVTAFLKTHLQPLYQAQVVDKETFKEAIQRTVSKVMSSHQQSEDASFLIAEGSRIRKLLLQYVKHITAKQSI